MDYVEQEWMITIITLKNSDINVTHIKKIKKSVYKPF